MLDERHYRRIIRHFHRMETMMSVLSEKLNALNSKVTDLESGEEAVGEALVAEIQRCNDRIAALEAEIEAGVATPEDLALIDSLTQRVEALSAQAGVQKAEADAAPTDPNPDAKPAPAAPPAGTEVPPTA